MSTQYDKDHKYEQKKNESASIGVGEVMSKLC